MQKKEGHHKVDGSGSDQIEETEFSSERFMIFGNTSNIKHIHFDNSK